MRSNCNGLCNADAPIRCRSRWYTSTCLASASQTITAFFNCRLKDANSTRNASRASSMVIDDVDARGTMGVCATEEYVWNFLITRFRVRSSLVIREWIIASSVLHKNNANDVVERLHTFFLSSHWGRLWRWCLCLCWGAGHCGQSGKSRLL